MSRLFLAVFLTTFALAIFLYGIWIHDWTVIVAGGAVAAIFPLIGRQVLTT